MRRTSLIAALLLITALPVCAQRRGFASPGRGNATFRSGGPSFHARTSFGGRIGGPVIAFGTGTFGRQRGFRVFVGPRYSYGRTFRSYERYAYSYPYAYPVVAYPYYPMTTDSEPVYMAPPPDTAPLYADNEESLVEQMRRERVGIYRNAEPPPPAPAAAPVRPGQEILEPSAVVIYRDGRRAEIRNYAIVGQTLWIFSEQLAHRVPLAEVDLEATRKANDDRGIDFLAPPK